MSKVLGYELRDLTIGRILAHQAARMGSKVFLKHLPDGRQFTYREVDQVSNRIANGFLATGLGKGSHVAVLMNNSPEMLFTFFALGKIGAVAVPINSAARGYLLTYFLDQSDSIALVIDADLHSRYAEISGKASKVGQVIVNGNNRAARSSAKTLAFSELLEHGADRPEVEVECSDLAMISYTSGTTGPSKGILFSHAREQYAPISNLVAYGFHDDDVMYVCLPMSHLAGRSLTQAALWSGATAAMTSRFSASRFWGDVRASGATRTNLLGSMVNILWGRPASADDAKHTLRTCIGAPVPSFAREFENRFGLRLVGGFGLADFGTVTTISESDPPAKLGSAGKLRPGWEVRVVDDADFQVPPGTPGEIICRCDHPWIASSGYYKMPEKTVETMRNGWFHTGDRGYFDEDGYLWFVDRKKDAIRRRGENISAFEVEQAISMHPAVAEVAAFAMRSEMSEDEVAVSLIVKQGMRLTEVELIEFCKDVMAYYMVPRFIRFVVEMPRNPTHKVEKYKLKEEADSNPVLYWDREKAGIVVAR